jgi:hypothetical protein
MGAASILGALIAIVRRHPNPGIRVGRPLWAGIPAKVCFSFVAILFPWIPLRRGEEWAFSHDLLPLCIEGVFVLTLDVLHVPRKNLFAALIPQVLCLGIELTRLILAGTSIF